MLSTLAMRTRSRPTSTTMDTPSWPSMPAMMTSPTTLLESLTLAVAPASITLSWLLDGELKMELTTGLSRTHGGHLGGTLDFSSSREALVVTPLSVVLLNVLPVAQLMMFLKPLLLEPKPSCDLTGWFGQITGTYNLEITSGSTTYATTCTCAHGFCTPNDSSGDACTAICGATTCG